VEPPGSHGECAVFDGAEVKYMSKAVMRNVFVYSILIIVISFLGWPAESKTFEVEFTFMPGRPGRSVCLAGTFNNWSITATPMEDADGDGIWKIVLSLPRGEHQYKFVVDGTVWVTDMKAEAFRDDGYGGRNSVVIVGDTELLKAECSAGDGQIVTEALWHENASPYVEREGSTTVAVRLRTRTSDVERVRMEYALNLSSHEGCADGFDNQARGSVRGSIPMEPYATAGGFTYYRAVIPASHGLLCYRFVLEDGDTRIWYSPAGANRYAPGADDGFELDLAGLSVFQTPEWVKDAVFYQIFPERFANGDPANDPFAVRSWGGTPTAGNFFGGDFQGVIDNISYLEELGITAIWFNPIFEAPSNHKYDTSDYMKIDPSFGGLDKFKEMVSALHAAGIKVILDGVFNHTGYNFWAFQDIVAKGRDSRYVNWYHIHDFPIRRSPKPNYEAWWGFPDLPQLNMENSEVRSYILDVVTYWMELGVDGWRLDVPNEIGHFFWREFRDHVKRINPDAYIIGEIWHNGSAWLQGDQFDAVMNYVFRDAVLDFFARKTCKASDFMGRLESTRADYPDAASMVLLNLLGSHDTERVYTAFRGNKNLMVPAIVFQMTYPGAPIVYYGDEIGMRGSKDPGCRGTMVWDESKQDRELLQLYKGLIRLRKSSIALRRGNMRWLLVDDPTRSFAFSRHYEGETVVVAVCAGDTGVSVDLAMDSVSDGTVFVDAFTGQAHEVAGGRLEVFDLGPGEARILVAGTPEKNPEKNP
jgi:cyclomaltodextrinase